ncbi:MAG: 8-amino-7-oxononanoate synthase [Candidatus Magnetominusculus sp. LBB02]|nr:8-amino-7-oxononanoate synthase [Candidatus Magnetominusculus sp. LBB02]
MNYKDKLDELRRQDLLRSVRDRDCPAGRTIKIGGRDLLNFSSNDYLGLASNHAIIEAAQNALIDFGHGAGASRLLSGGTTLHATLQIRTAAFKGTEKALLFNSGYAANTGAIPALTDAHTAIFSDELNHASIVDGCRLSAATERHIYKHNDLNHLEALLSKSQRVNKLIVTESIFSMDGDVADICNLNMLCARFGAALYIDDAHATGVIGGGRGALAHFNIVPQNHIIQMGTYSKALGSVGGFAAAEKQVIDYLCNTARTLIYSTALPASAVAASIAAIDYIAAHPELIVKLRDNIATCRKLLIARGFPVTLDETPIIPVMFSTSAETLTMSARLLAQGIYAPAIRPPTVKAPRIRISISAFHERGDVTHLVNALYEAAR